MRLFFFSGSDHHLCPSRALAPWLSFEPLTSGCHPEPLASWLSSRGKRGISSSLEFHLPLRTGSARDLSR